jgi:signal transduction histidine kinase
MRRSQSSFLGEALSMPALVEVPANQPPGGPARSDSPEAAVAVLDSGLPRAGKSRLEAGGHQAARADRRSELNPDVTRAVLALATALLSLESGRDLGAALTLAATGFAIYAAALLLVDLYGSRTTRSPAFSWIDALWCLLIFSLSGGSGGFSILLFFPVLFAAGRGSLLSSLAIAVVCAAVALVVLEAQSARVSWVSSLFVPAAVLVVGSGMALLTHVEACARRVRVAAAEMVDALDPRRGLDAVINKFLQLTAMRFAAEDAVLVLQGHAEPMRVFTYRPDSPTTELPGAAGALASQLQGLSREATIAFAASPILPWLHASYSSLNVRSGIATRSYKAPPSFAAVMALLEQHFVALTPAGKDDATAIWVLLGRGRRAFSRSEQVALHGMAEQVVPVLDNAILLEQLVAATADTERMRIGRDLHDSAIQPYMGLKFAVEALARRVPGDSPLANEVHLLLNMVNQELQSLREIVSGLRSRRSHEEALLERAVRRQAARFARLFGMDVQVRTHGDLRMSRHLSGELFHMVSEALSNVRRHTHARRATVTLAGGDDVVLEVVNESLPDESCPVAFEPHSLTERAADLGGSVEVDITAEGTTVRVRIPWPAEEKP